MLISFKATGFQANVFYNTLKKFGSLRLKVEESKEHLFYILRLGG